MSKLKDSKWLSDVVERSVKTFAQSIASYITIGAAFSEIDWKTALSCAFVAAIYSVVTSVATIPGGD